MPSNGDDNYDGSNDDVCNVYDDILPDRIYSNDPGDICSDVRNNAHNDIHSDTLDWLRQSG